MFKFKTEQKYEKGKTAEKGGLRGKIKASSKMRSS